MPNKIYKFSVLLTAALVIGGCQYRYKSFNDIFGDQGQIASESVDNAPLRQPNSVVVCRSKQCAPAKLSMSNEYMYNSLLQLFENNNHDKALICQADPHSRTCTENYITLPITVGITPAYMYMDSVKISDILINKGSETLNILLNYNVTYNGQTPECTPSKSILYVRNINHILLEDGGYSCKMTSVGTSHMKTVFVIDYIDLDYGFIGGYYSIGLSGPAYGGGTGYMLLRLPKDAYPLKPVLMAPKKTRAQKKSEVETAIGNLKTEVDTTPVQQEEPSVKVFPLPKN